MTDFIPRPGQRIRAKVNGRNAIVVLSLETEEKGDRRDHCYRWNKPHFPIIPKESKVEVLGPYDPLSVDLSKYKKP